jgi:hypothetical protein
MKSEKEKLALKTIDQLKAAAKRVGANVVDPKSGKAKTKVQLINAIIMVQRLGKAKKQIKTLVKKQTDKKTAAASRQTNQRQRNIAKDIDREAEAPGKRTSKTGKVYYERRANRSDVPPTMLGNSTNYYNLNLSRAFTVSVLPKTQTQKARVKIYDGEYNETKMIPYVADGSGGGITAQGYLESLGIKISARAYSKKTVLLLTKNFTTPIINQ